ncbi:MAG TPA: MBL fold metallo-hydrolase [Vicinamibacterales bacterium]|nr:MBL fold metallo-hydrolase [Vicinamibacterales bacterium]
MEITSVPLRLISPNPGPLTGHGNNTWLFDGDEPTLIDAGGTPEHLSALAAHLGDRPLARVLVTHGHLDHAGGVPALRERWPDLLACKFPLPGESGWQPLSDGDIVQAGRTALTVLHTPGHAPDHVCFWDEASRGLYAGDMVIAGTTVMIPAGRGGSLRAYLQSLERLIALAPRRIYPGHGPVIDHPVEVLRAYLAHRHEREAQVLDCLRRGLTDPDAIVTSIYGVLEPSIFNAARQTILAHLDKLREDDPSLLD